MSPTETSAKAVKADSLFTAPLAETDPEIAEAIRKELGRQRDEIELIASENIVSRAVLEAQGSVLTNKYAEGLPGKRYYGGCQYVDVAENLAIDRVKKLFGVNFANVQPHSGASANVAAFMALMQPGDTFMGLNLAAGGHLTHGSPVNYSGKWYKVVPYGVRRDDHRIDMDEVRKLAQEHRPKVIVTGGSAYPRIIDFKAFREIAGQVGNDHPVGMPTSAYTTSDGYLNINSLGQAMWVRLCKALGKEEWIKHPDYATNKLRQGKREELNAKIEEITSKETRAQLIDGSEGTTQYWLVDTVRRHPAMLAQTALTLDHLSKGRFILGVGSGETENTVPYGFDFNKPVSRFEGIDRIAFRASAPHL